MGGISIGVFSVGVFSSTSTSSRGGGGGWGFLSGKHHRGTRIKLYFDMGYGGWKWNFVILLTPIELRIVRMYIPFLDKSPSTCFCSDTRH
jgi:hypothetical protein